MSVRASALPEARRRVGALAVAFAVLAALVSISTLPAAGNHGDEHPRWNCDGIPLLMRGSKLFRVLPDPTTPGELTLEEIAIESGIANSTAYDPVTNLLYGVTKIAGVPNVRTYDANGAIIDNVPIQAPYPSDAGQYAGTVLGDGRYIIHSVGDRDGVGWYDGQRFNLWSVDPLTGSSIHIGATTANMADLAYNPLDGYLYHASKDMIYRFDPNTGAETSYPIDNADEFPNGGYGASWFDASGFLYIFLNKPGEIYRLDVTNQTWSFAGLLGQDGGTDGTSCVSKVDITKDVIDGEGNFVLADDRLFNPGDIVTYRITVINNGLPTKGLNTRVCDTLPADGRTFTGVWSSSVPSATLSSGGSAGSTSFCVDVDVDSSLWTDPATPGADPTTIDVQVQIPTTMAPGTYENQATLDLDKNGTVDEVSDDPGDSSDPRDPTTIRVSGDVVITKVVKGLPDGAPTDSFPVTVVCTDQTTGSAAIVSSDMITKASDGSPWTGATTNGFTINDGDQVRVSGLPPGASCSINESPAPTGYSVDIGGTTDTVAANGGVIIIDQGPDIERFDLTNQTATFAISKRTSVGSDRPIELDATFDFSVECDNGQSFETSITTVDGSGTVGYPDIPLVGDGATCTVTEDVPAGWSTTAPSQKVTMASGTIPEVRFENTRLTGSLVATKAIVGLPKEEDPADYTFEITVTCDGGFKASTYSVPGPLMISVDQALTIPDLPVGTSCTVTETRVPGFTASYTPEATVTITEDGSTVDVLNSTGSLIVKKDTIVTSDLPVDLVADFDFTIRCVDGSGTTIYNEAHTLTTSALTETGTTGGIGYGDLPLLPAGTTCTVTETPASGWTAEGPTEVSLEVTAANPEPMAIFVNRRDVASLVIDKSLAGVPEGIDLSSEPFTVSVTCSGDFTDGSTTIADRSITSQTDVTISGIPTGSGCAATEAADPRFAVTVSPRKVEVTDAGAAISITNTTATISINKATKTSSDFDLDLDETFRFDWKCDTTPTTTGSFSITTTDGSGSSAVGDQPLVAPGTVCVVAETGLPTGWILADRSGGTTSGSDAIMVKATDPTPTIEFVNVRSTATLSITKSVVGAPAGVDLDDEVFDLTVTCTGAEIGTNYVVPGPLTVTANDPLLIEGLPTDSSCTVTEATDERFSTTYDPAPTVTVTGKGSSVEIINTTSSVAVTKAVKSDSTYPLMVDGSFDFSITCSAPDGSVLHTSDHVITTIDGAGRFEGDGGPLVPPGTACSVTETPTSGWTPVGAIAVDLETSAAPIAEAQFTNRLDTADLTIDKTVLASGGLDFSAEPFAISVTCIGGFTTTDETHTIDDLIVTPTSPVVLKGLPIGSSCAIIEGPDSRFATYYSPAGVDPSGAKAAVVTLTADTEAGVVNAGGTLIIRKITSVDSDLPIDLFEDFTFNIDCGSAYQAEHIIAVDQMSGSTGVGGVTWTELPTLPVGTSCTVTESGTADWTITSSNPQTVVVTSDEQATTVFDNKRKTGDLAIDLTLLGVPPGTDLSNEPFEVTVTCTGDFTSSPHTIGPLTITDTTPVLIEDLPTGASCSVAVAPDSRFEITSDPGGAITIVEGTSTVDVTAATSTISVTKTTQAPDGSPATLTGSFTVEVVCTSGGRELFNANVGLTTTVVAPATTGTGVWESPNTPLVPPGTTCVVSESSPPTGWTVIGPASASLVTDWENVETFDLVNQRDTGSFTVSKTVLGAPAESSFDEESFNVSIVCTGDFPTSPYNAANSVALSVASPVVLENLPTGARCAVTEEEDPRYHISYPSGSSAVVTTLGSKVEIRNSTGQLAIVKTVDGPTDQSLDLSGTFTFRLLCDDGRTDQTVTITIDGSQGGSQTGSSTWPTLPSLPTGTTCTVSETVPSGWTLAGQNRLELTVGVGTPEGSGTARFENKRTVGSVTISKTVLGAPSGSTVGQETFTVDVTCTGSLVGGSSTFNDLDVSAASPATITGLPTGATCSVTEDGDDRFATSYSPSNGAGTAGEIVVDADGETVSVINSTGEIFLTKTAQGPSSHPIALALDLAVAVDCGSAFDETVIVPVDTELSASTMIGSLGYDDLPLLPAGTVCTAVETVPVGWTQVSGPAGSVTIDPDTVAQAGFVNQRQTAPLNITVDVVGLTPGIDLSGEPFTVEVVCSGGFTTSTYEVPGPLTVSESVPLTIADLPVGTSCIVTVADDDRFAISEPAAPTVVPTGGATAEILAEVSTISISKTTATTDTHPLGVDATFSFMVDCFNNVNGDGTSVIATASFDLVTVDGAASTTAPNNVVVPPKTSCRVVETQTDGWAAVEADLTIVTERDDVVSADFVNNRETGRLTISKALVGVPAEVDLEDEDFAVSVTCTGDFVASPYSVPGPLVVSADTDLVIEDLPAGATCTVAEAVDDRFSTTYSPANDSGSAAEVVIETAGSTVTITNTTGTLAVTKTVLAPQGNDIDLAADFKIQVTCTGPDSILRFDGTITITTDGSVASGAGQNSDDTSSSTWTAPDAPLLPPGSSCEVDEPTTPTGWSRISQPTEPLIISADEVVEATVVNRRDTESLTVTKTLVGVPAELDFSDVQFAVTVRCRGDFIGNQADGTHLVAGPTTVSVDTPLIVSGLPTGAICEVAEQTDPRFATTYLPEAADANSSEVSIYAGSGASVSIENSTGSIIVAKRTESPTTHPINLNDTFSFDLDCGAVHRATYDITADLTTSTGGLGLLTWSDVPLLPNGTSCTITELDAGSKWSPVGDATQTLTISSDEEATVEFLNARQVGSLEITKELAGVPTELDLSDEPFDVLVSCRGDFDESPYEVPGPLTVSTPTPLVIADLPSEAECSVTEVPDSRFASSSNPVDGSATIEADATATVALLNETGTISIDLTAEAPGELPIDLEVSAEFELLCAASDGTEILDQALTLTTDVSGRVVWAPSSTPLMPPGTVCQVTLLTPAAWGLTSEARTIALTVPDPGTSPAIPVAAFTIERATAALKINKILEGVEADAVDPADANGGTFGAIDFNVLVRCVGGFSTEDDTVEIGGPESDLTISALTGATVEDLPTGTSCTVIEAPSSRFTASYEPANATVAIDGESGGEVTVTNKTGTLLVVKTTSTESPYPIDLSGRFRFSVDCDDDTYVEVVVPVSETAPGVDANLQGSIDWSETGFHAVGTVCTITEIEVPDGWSLESAESVDVTIGAIPEVAYFTNVRTTGTLLITKTITDGPDTDDERRFNVTVACSGGFTSPTIELSGQVAVDAPLSFEGLPSGSACTVTEEADDDYLPIYAPNGSTVRVGIDVAEVAIENVYQGSPEVRGLTSDRKELSFTGSATRARVILGLSVMLLGFILMLVSQRPRRRNQVL